MSAIEAAAEPLIGRHSELASIQELLAQPGVRLLTILGAPGAGKTRLALEVLSMIREQAEREVCFVPLAPLQQESLVLTTICHTLGIPEAVGSRSVRRLADALAGRRVLLVLDNFEHLLGAASDVSQLVSMCPELQILATSRAPLNVYAERRFLLSPLATPGSASPMELESLADVPSVALFVERARAARYDFRLSAGTVVAVAELCRRLDGLPLAIELAAARVRYLPPAALLARLGQRFDLLGAGPRDAPRRHQTLWQALDWSYGLLEAAERQVFRHLSVFRGGFTLEAAASVCDSSDVLQATGSLVDQCLLVMSEQRDGEPRFSMLETVREYALSQLAASDELEPTHQRLLVYALGVAERAEPELIGPGQRFWLDRLDQELTNLRTALAWSIEHQPQAGLRLGRALWRYWSTHGHVAEGLEWLLAALKAVPATATHARADALHAAGDLARDHGEPGRAAALHRESLTLRRTIGDRAGVAASLGSLGVVEKFCGNYERSVSLLEESLALRRELGDEWGTALQLTHLAQVQCELGHYAAVLTVAEESTPLLGRLGDRRCLSRLLNWSGIARHGLGELEAARALHTKALAISRELGDRRGEALARNRLGCIATDDGDIQAAHAHLTRALSVYRKCDNPRDMGRCLTSFAHLAFTTGKHAQAVQLFASAQAMVEGAGSSLPPAEHVLQKRAISRLRARLDEAHFSAAWTAGYAMQGDEAAQYAPDEPRATPSPVQADVDVAPALTPRERQVAVLVARGLTDRQIAGELVISQRTAGAHVSNILAKLGVRSRAQVAVWVTARGLLCGV